MNRLRLLISPSPAYTLRGKGRAAAGITITEFMIGLALSLLVVLFAIALFWSTRITYITQDQNAKLNETGRFVSQTLTRLIRQTAFVPIGDEDGTPLQISKANFQHGIHGYDSGFISEEGLQNPPLPPVDPAKIDCPAGAPVIGGDGTGLNSCDSITLRFFGAGIPGSTDGSITDCVGQPIRAPIPAAGGDLLTAESDRAVNHLFLSMSEPDKGVMEPQLFCRWRSMVGDIVRTQPLASGIESLQFLYGIQARGAGLAFLTAEQMNGLAVPPNPSLGASVPNSAWLQVVAVRYAFIVRSARGARTDLDSTIYRLFGTDGNMEKLPQKPPGGYPYGDAIDLGTEIDASKLPKEERTRLRKVFSGVVHLRNESGGSS